MEPKQVLCEAARAVLKMFLFGMMVRSIPDKWSSVLSAHPSCALGLLLHKIHGIQLKVMDICTANVLAEAKSTGKSNHIITNEKVGLTPA